MDNFNLDSNGTGDDSRDVSMASPSQISPMGSNSNPLTTNNQNSNNSGPPTPSGGKANNEVQPIIPKPRLTELVREVDVTAQLDDEVEEVLLQMMDDFIEDTIKTTVDYAKHRKVSKVEVRDVQLHLERKWNMWIPGFGTDELRPYKRAAITEAHKQRLALIRKTIKKY